MKTPNFFKTGIALIALFALCSVKLFAQDKMTLTWKVDITQGSVKIFIRTYDDKPFMVNWGDGIIETTSNFHPYTYTAHSYETGGEYEVTVTGATSDCWLGIFECHYSNNYQISKLDFHNCSHFMSVDCSNNQLTSLNLSNNNRLMYLCCNNNELANLNLVGCTALGKLNCNNNQISHLEISTNKELILYCENNRLTSLDLSNCYGDISAYCHNNQLQLSDMYAIQSIKEGYYEFGSQYLPATWKNLETELFADQSVFNEIFTQYTVEINGEPAPESAYSVTDGKLTFHTLGNYTVTMTNDAIISLDGPAKVIVDIEVVPLGISENEALNISVYPNPTTGELHVTNVTDVTNDIEIFDVYGKKQSHGSRVTCHEFNISHLPAGIYFVKITTEKGEVVKKVVKQ